MASKIDKEELAQKINSLEGLDNETKSQLLELLHERKRYGLVWEEKVEDVEERLRSELPVLREVKERALLSKDPEAPNHILIEGDNLEALTALSYMHEGKIDVIYIDPPYNTGNKDFVYNDAYVDSEDEYRHSKWLSFMAKRLNIAKRLLSSTGFIFISIDEREYANLKVLSDGIFGESKFVGTLHWHKKVRPSNKLIDKEREISMGLSANIEYILCYANEAIITPDGLTAKGLKAYKNPDNDPRGPWITSPLWADSNSNKPSTLKLPDGTELTKKWFVGQDTLDELFALNMIHHGKDGFRKKVFLSEVVGQAPMNFLSAERFGTSDNGTDDYKAVMGAASFTNPKPLALIKYLLNLKYENKNAVILDFFAGSGTTLHATMEMNAEDKGFRQCILVQAPETTWEIIDGKEKAKKWCEAAYKMGYKTISDITYERNRRVIVGYLTTGNRHIEGLHANTLRYYRTDFVGRENTLQNRRKLVYLATDMLCIKEDCYNEQPCIDKQARLFTNNEKRLIILYNPDLIPELVTFIANLPEGEKIKVYVFADGAYPYTDDFSEVLDKIELCAIPDAILNAMRRVLPQKKVKALEPVTPDKAMQEDIQHALDNATINDYKKTEIW